MRHILLTTASPLRRVAPMLPTVGPWANSVTIAFGLAALVLYAKPYYGIVHDGIFYSLQALVRLHPEALADDLFFRHGSQDSLTIFSPLYATAISRWGLEAAALVLTLVAHALSVAAAWWIARAFLPAGQAWLAVGLFIAIPGTYGAESVFRYSEAFVSARPFAEAATLGAIACLIHDRKASAVLLGLLALCLHPLMASAGLALGVLLVARGHVLAAAMIAAAAAALASLAIAVWAPTGPLRLLDPEWTTVLQDFAPYLFVENWALIDWQRVAVPLATLVIATFLLRHSETGHPRVAVSAARITGSAALAGAAGIALSVIAMAAPIALLVQGQPWRWMWLAKAIAILALIPIGKALWERGSSGRVILLLLGVAWAGAEDAGGIPAALLALLLTLVLIRGGPRHSRLVLPAGAFAAVVFGLAVVQTAGWHRMHSATLGVLALGWLTFGTRSSWPRAAAATIAATAFALQFWTATLADTSRRYDAASTTYLESWRARIAPGETVFYPEAPEAVWLQLHRKSYWMYTGVVFSREAALATAARAAALKRYAAGRDGAYWGSGSQRLPSLTIALLAALCADAEIDYVVSADAIPAPSMPGPATGPFAGARLYPCAPGTSK